MKFLKILSILIIALVIIYIIVAKAVLPEKIKDELPKAFAKICKTCKLSVDEVETSLFLNKVKLEDVTVSAGHLQTTFVEAKVEEIDLTFEVAKLLDHQIIVNQISIEEPNVHIIEGDDKTTSRNQKSVSDWVFDIQEIDIKDGHFVYTKEHKGNKAPITVKKINAFVSRITNQENLKDLQSQANVDAQLEESGGVNIKISTAPFLEFQNVSVALNINNQNLKEMNSYFKPNDGIELAGILEKGTSHVNVLSNRVKATVRAEFKDLDVTFRDSKDRSATETFFSNLISSVKIKKENTDLSKSEQTDSVAITQNPEETLISFIFRGMKEAALKVAQGEKASKAKR